MDDRTVVTTTQPAACACAQPVPEVRATRKGAARTHCARCDRPLRLAFDAR